VNSLLVGIRAGVRVVIAAAERGIGADTADRFLSFAAGSAVDVNRHDAIPALRRIRDISAEKGIFHPENRVTGPARCQR